MAWSNTAPGRDRKLARQCIKEHGGICHVCGQPGATQADHVIPLAENGPPGIDNLRPIHKTPCHLAKTQAEAGRGRARKSPTRKPPPHPSGI